MTDEVQWLDDDEQATWRLLVTVLLMLPSRLDARLRPHGLTFFDYLLLAMLSESEGDTRPMRRLAEVTNSSLSRLSHAVRRLEERGLVCRRPSPADGRVTLALLTSRGRALVEQAAPDHVASVRDLVMDNVDDDQVTALGDALRAIVAELAPGVTPGVDADC